MKEIIKDIKGLSADSRKIKPGYLFAALPGTKADGRDFIPQAIKAGATHILTSYRDNIPKHINVIESQNPRLDFAKLCAIFYDTQPATVIAVTGTNGKTSTVEFIRQILDQLGEKSASLGTLGLVSHHTELESRLTTPGPEDLHPLLANLAVESITHVAMEASSHGLDQYRLHGVKLSAAAFTNLSQDHLDYHKDMESYFQAKHKLFTELLPADKPAIINSDDPYAQKIVHRNKTGYGFDEAADIRIINYKTDVAGQELIILHDDQPYKIALPLIGKFQAYNALCAASCCIALGYKPSRVFATLETLEGVPGRLQLAAQNGHKAAYIDYAHTPDALEKVLKALRPHVGGRLICVYGAGGDRDPLKRPFMGIAVRDNADIAIITDDNPRSEDPAHIRAAIQDADPKAHNIDGRHEAITHGVSLMEDGDVLLVAGKGHEQGQDVKGEIIPFDDLTETQKAMQDKV